MITAISALIDPREIGQATLVDHGVRKQVRLVKALPSPGRDYEANQHTPFHLQESHPQHSAWRDSTHTRAHTL